MTRKKLRYLKNIVRFCLLYTALVVQEGLFVCWRVGADPTGVVDYAIKFFGVELALAALIKLFEKKKENEK